MCEFHFLNSMSRVLKKSDSNLTEKNYEADCLSICSKKNRNMANAKFSLWRLFDISLKSKLKIINNTIFK